MKVAWTATTLGDSCEMYQPKTISTKEMLEDGEYPVYGANGVIGRYHHYNHEDSQLLITCRGATCGSVNVSEPYSWITGNAMVVRPKDGSISLKFLEYLFRGGIDITKAITGAAQPQITRTNLAPLEFFYPSSLPEQHRIVAILDEAFDGIAIAKANAEKNLQNARALFESHLQSVFTERGEGWREITLENCCAQIFAGGDVPKNSVSQERTAQFNVPIFSNGAKDDGLYGFTENARVMKPSITISARGTIGFTAIRTEPFLPVVRLIVLIPDERSIELSFLYYAVLGMDFGNTGTSIPQLTVPNLKGRNLYLPSIPQQRGIVARLDEIREETQRLESIYQQKLTALDDLKKSLLHQAFSGAL